MSKRLQHAQHNEAVCDSLCSLESNVDWVITTAFYSALHFLEHKKFPHNHKDNLGNKIKLKSFDDYYGLFHSNGKPNKHAVRLKLAEEIGPPVSSAYKWLKDACWSARYSEYQFSDNKVYIDIAKKKLKAIKDYCEN